MPKFVSTAVSRCEFVTVGLNPSYPSFERLNRDFIRAHGLNAENYVAWFDWATSGLAEGFDPSIVERLAVLHRAAKDYYAFFERMKMAAKEFGSTQFEHVDLFLLLEADSRTLPKDYWKAKNHKHSIQPNFIQSQMDIAYKILAAHRPDVMLSVYGSVGDILLRYFKSRKQAVDRKFFRIPYQSSVSAARVNFGSGRNSLLIRWPSFPKSCRGSMPDEVFKEALDDVKHWLEEDPSALESRLPCNRQQPLHFV